MYTKIIGIGSYLPKKIRTNSDLEKTINITNDWIVTRTGILERRIASKKETVSYMGYMAAIKALKMSGINKNDIELIIVATTTSCYAFPSTACIIQNLLNIKDCIAFDVSAACTGFIYAISIANQYIKSKTVKLALVVGSDVLTNSLNPKDKNTFILFGDGSGAVVLGISKTAGIISTHLHSNGQYNNLLTLRYRTGITRNISYISMIGNQLFKIAVDSLIKVTVETLAINRICSNDLDWLIPHQANIRIIRTIIKKLNIPMSKVLITLNKYGNMSAASIPVSLNEVVQTQILKKGQLVLLEAFGSGLTWGSVLFRY